MKKNIIIAALGRRHGFSRMDGRSIVNAAVEAVDNHNTLAAKAGGRAAEWRRKNCAAALLDEIAARLEEMSGARWRSAATTA